MAVLRSVSIVKSGVVVGALTTNGINVVRNSGVIGRCMAPDHQDHSPIVQPEGATSQVGSTTLSVGLCSYPSALNVPAGHGQVQKV